MSFDSKYNGLQIEKLLDDLITSEESGIKRLFLRENIVNGINVLTPDMISEKAIYIIRYDYDLQGNEISIPEGSLLDFRGGSLNNGLISSTETFVSGMIRISCDIEGVFQRVEDGTLINKVIFI